MIAGPGNPLWALEGFAKDSLTKKRFYFKNIYASEREDKCCQTQRLSEIRTVNVCKWSVSVN